MRKELFETAEISSIDAIAVARIERTKLIGHRIRQQRKLRGWSLADLCARTAGVLSKSRLSNYEQGIRRPSIEVAQVLSDVFGDVTAAWVLGMDDVGQLVEPERGWIEAFRKLDNNCKQIVLRMAEAAAG